MKVTRDYCVVHVGVRYSDTLSGCLQNTSKFACLAICWLSSRRSNLLGNRRVSFWGSRCDWR